MSTRYNPSIVSDNLVLYVDAANTKSYPLVNATWFDISRNGNDGTLSGPVFNSNFGGYFDFDGSNDQVSVPDTNDFTLGANDFTMDFWGYMDSLPGSGNEYGMVGQDGIGSDQSTAIRWKNDGGTMKVIFILGGLGSMEPAASLPAGQWIYCACGRRSGTTFVNVNGVDISTSSSFSGSLNNSTNPFYIGRSSFSSRYLDGRIAAVRFYVNGSLSEIQTKQNYNAHKARFGI